MLPLLSSLLFGLTMQAGQTAPAASLAVPAAQSQASTTTTAESYNLFAHGRMLEAHGDLPGAIEAYRKAIELSPKAADIHAELAGLYARDGRAQEAITEGNAALAIDPANREAHRILGLVDAALADQAALGQSGAPAKQALSHLEQAYAGGARDPMVLLTLGRLEVEAEQYPKGIEVLTAFLLAEPGYPDAVQLLVEAYDNSGQVAQAIDQLEDLAASQPDSVRAQSWLAELYERAGRWKDAAAKWGALAMQSPQTVSYRIRRAGALINSGGAGLSAGRDILIDVVKESPKDAGALFLLAQAYRQLGDAAAAEDSAKRIIDLDARDPRGPLAMADAKTAAKDFKGAVAVLDPLYASVSATPGPNPARAVIAMALAESLRAAGEDARAISVLEATSRENPDDLDLSVSVASAYEHAGKADQAERLLRALIAKHPESGSALNSLAYLLASHNQKLDEAVGLVKRALAAEADNPAYLDSLGWVYLKQRKLTDAVSPLERAASALPRDSAVLDHLGELYFQQKRYREAAEAWTRALDGDRAEIDVAALTKKRDHARDLAK